MPEPVDLTYAIGLPPVEAIAYFRAKGYEFSWNWFEVWQEAHTKAFTVAKAMRMDVLQDIRDALDAALANGTTLDTFKKDLKPLLEAKGWWGKTEEGVQLGSGHRLETIFRTNIQTAYSAGRYRMQAEDVDNRPYWQYVAVMDNRTRPEHAELNGLTFKSNDVFWQTMYPPNGWNCRCRVRTFSDSDIKHREITIDEGEGQMVWKDQKVARGITEPVCGYKNPETGKTAFTDPGWSYNPGKTAWKPDMKQYDPALRKIVSQND